MHFPLHMDTLRTLRHFWNANKSRLCCAFSMNHGVAFFVFHLTRWRNQARKDAAYYSLWSLTALINVLCKCDFRFLPKTPINYICSRYFFLMDGMISRGFYSVIEHIACLCVRWVYATMSLEIGNIFFRALNVFFSFVIFSRKHPDVWNKCHIKIVWYLSHMCLCDCGYDVRVLGFPDNIYWFMSIEIKLNTIETQIVKLERINKRL